MTNWKIIYDITRVSFTHPAMFLLVMLVEGFGEGGAGRDADGTEVGGDGNSGTCDPLFCF